MKNRILVLDDRKNIREHMKYFLEHIGYEVYPSHSIEEATEIIRTTDFDFALIDLKIDVAGEYGGKAIIKELNDSQQKAVIIIGTGYYLDDKLRKELSDVKYDKFVCKGEENYYDSVIQTLKDAQNQFKSKKCFVIMPFRDTSTCTSKQWQDIFENTIKPAVEDSGFNYECYKMDISIGNITESIIDNLYEADVVIADLTDENPNVFYELGVRHALRDSTVLITQKINKAPFDIRTYAMIEYDWTTKDGREIFSKDIKKTFQDIEKDKKNIVSPVLSCLKLESKNGEITKKRYS